MINKRVISQIFIILIFTTLQSKAQIMTEVSGKVTNLYGKPLAGVVISLDNKKNVYITDHEGRYNFFVDETGKKLIFSLIGYKVQTKSIEDVADVVLEEDGHAKAEIINFGFTKQSRDLVSNAVSTVSGRKLEQSLMPRLQGTLSGQLSGLTTIENSFQPMIESIDLYIRGFSTYHGGTAGVVIDGILYDKYSHDLLYRITPEEVESISILKDGASQAIYGLRGARGLIVITTKRGLPGKLKVNVTMDETVQQQSFRPQFINSATYATLRNQAAYNDGLGENYYYTEEQIEKFSAGDDPLYPNTNWFEMMVRELSHMQRVGVDATGGTGTVQYYANVNMAHQGSFWNTDQTEYNVNNEVYKINMRANVDIKINKYLGGYINMAGNIIRRHDPAGNAGSGNNSIYSLLHYMPPTLYGPVTPTVYDEDGNMIDPGGEVTTTTNIGSSPYGLLNRSGYYTQTNTNIYSQAGLKLDMSFLTPGLSIGGNVGYLSYITAYLKTTQSYARYTRDDDWSTLSFTQHGTTQNTDLVYNKSSQLYGYLSYKGEANYERDFDKHHLKTNLFGIYQVLDDHTDNVGAEYEFRRIYSGVEVQYDFDKRYAIKFDLGYSGSDYFPKGNRFLCTPGISAAWIASNESFVKKSLPWLTLAKPRFSFGITGNDDIELDRYDYLEQVSVSGNGTLGYLGYKTNESSYGNTNLAAEAIKKYNIGLDLGFANQFTISVDFFKERMDNGVYQSTSEIPAYQGIPLSSFPSINFAEFENHGYEVELNYMKRYNKDWTFNLGGFVSYSKNKIVYVGETPKDEDYAYPYRKEGFPLGQIFGYLVDYSNGNGFYNFQDEIDAGPTYSFGTPRLGDLRFQDLNGDNIIDTKDQAPLGKGTLPQYYFGISGGVNFKNFELSFLFQGVAEYYRNFYTMISNESSYDGKYSESHLNAWTEERWLNKEKITYPALSTSNSTSKKYSDFFIKDCSFIRLKNVELSYSLPQKTSNFLGAKSIKLILGGQNLFTIDKLDTNDMAVEGSYSYFPIYRMYRIGIKAQF